MTCIEELGESCEATYLPGLCLCIFGQQPDGCLAAARPAALSSALIEIPLFRRTPQFLSPSRLDFRVINREFVNQRQLRSVVV